MPKTTEEIKEYKESIKKSHGKDITDEEAKAGLEFAEEFARLLIKQAEINIRRKKRLEKETDGFHLDESDGIYNCRICNQHISGSETWWDLNGVKCLDCQRNLREGIIPVEICQDDKLLLKEWEIKYEYSIHHHKMKKLLKDGILKPRHLMREDGSVYFTYFLKKENKRFLKLYPKKPKLKIKYIDPYGKEIEL